MRKKRLLLIDDDPLVVKFVEAGLGRQGFDVACAGDGPSGVHAALTEPFDLVILDVLLPGFEGTEVCRRIREESTVPILMLSVQGSVLDKTTALNLGADDYLTKPFALEELVARINAILRRSLRGPAATPRGRLHAGDITVDQSTHTVQVGERKVPLTPTEYALLQELVANANAILTHRDLLSRVWGSEHAGDAGYLHVFVSRLRRKLEPEAKEPRYIVTVPGIGYLLRVSPDGSDRVG